jgi:hypothetical protein
VANLKQDGARFRNDVVIGNGGKQILVDDPSGNAIELFEPGALSGPVPSRGRPLRGVLLVQKRRDLVQPGMLPAPSRPRQQPG